MGKRSKMLAKALVGPKDIGDACLVLLQLLEVQEEILEELRNQNDDDQEEEQGPTSLSDT